MRGASDIAEPSFLLFGVFSQLVRWLEVCIKFNDRKHSYIDIRCPELRCIDSGEKAIVLWFLGSRSPIILRVVRAWGTEKEIDEWEESAYLIG